ncbi:16S rRNA (guanine527-N7)-methyltransferase [Sphingomonas jejuensis]|uniref:Ribosomal RNA small subunit methyltransferase G n=1 Tax=Sphingomonas jejuensis TaxID=904715 RepID=A0ABX0XNJ5_9SPHN|nr:RsmG family class I SAM-dependent methyltransferase [Sphingomonas jejuensis]NJC34948.1 16S rRNA (guanine527-N7)-methyltransferase [Sphingomonas jejuensis]
MTEEEAVGWCEARFSGGEMDRLSRYVALLTEEAARQNLVSAATLSSAWSRHIVDSAQLACLLRPGSVVDIGSGAGLPGIVLACLDHPMTLVEPRPRRVDFLRRCVQHLELNCSIFPVKAAQAKGVFANIVGRAVSPPSTFINDTQHLATKTTRWVLPAGRSAYTWESLPLPFHVEQSVTDADAGIIVAEQPGEGP